MPSLLSLRNLARFQNEELHYMRDDTGVKQRFVQAITQQESGGDYKALSKINKKGQRAYGKYQVMDFNIPVWTKEVLGRSLTPQQFLNDSKAQDAVAQKRLGDLYDKHGVADAAAYWFSGGSLKKNAKNKDINGKTVESYVVDIQKRMSDTFGQKAYADTIPQETPTLLGLRKQGL